VSGVYWEKFVELYSSPNGIEVGLFKGSSECGDWENEEVEECSE